MTFTQSELPTYAPRDAEKWNQWMAEAKDKENDHAVKRLKEYIDSGEELPKRRFDAYAVMLGDE